MPAPLGALPNELILFLAEEIRKDERRLSSFWSLCLTSRRFNVLITPFLYERVDSESGDTWRFLRTILHASRLAKLVRSVRWVNPSPRFEEYTPFRNGLYEVMKYIGTSLGKHPNTYAKQLGLACMGEQRTGYQVILSAIIMFAPMIESIEGPCSAYVPQPDITWIAAMQHAQLDTYKHLRSIKIVAQVDKDVGFEVLRSTVPLISTFLFLPTLRSLDITNYTDFENGSLSEEICRVPPLTSNLEVLKLRRACISTYDVVSILQACSKLKTFLFAQTRLEDKAHPLKWNLLCEGLAFHVTSLENLAIIQHSSEEYDNGSYLLEGEEVVDLHKFVKVRNLIIPHTVLCAPDGSAKEALPPSLDHLTIVNPRRNFSPFRDGDGKPAEAPQLRSFTIAQYYSQMEGERLPHFPNMGYAHTDIDLKVQWIPLPEEDYWNPREVEAAEELVHDWEEKIEFYKQEG